MKKRKSSKLERMNKHHQGLAAKVNVLFSDRINFN